MLCLIAMFRASKVCETILSVLFKWADSSKEADNVIAAGLASVSS